MSGRRYRKKVSNKKANRRFLICISILVLFASIYFIHEFLGQSYMMAEINEQINRKKDEVDEINTEISKLEDELEIVDTPEFIEKIAREKLKMVKPRDIIYIDEDGPANIDEATSEDKRMDE